MTKCPVCSEAKTANMWCKWKQEVQPAIYFDLWPVYSSPHGHNHSQRSTALQTILGLIKSIIPSQALFFCQSPGIFLQHSLLDSSTQNPWMMKCTASWWHHGQWIAFWVATDGKLGETYWPYDVSRRVSFFLISNVQVPPPKRQWTTLAKDSGCIVPPRAALVARQPGPRRRATSPAKTFTRFDRPGVSEMVGQDLWALTEEMGCPGGQNSGPGLLFIPWRPLLSLLLLCQVKETSI